MPQPDRARAALSRTSGTPAGVSSPSAIEYAIIAILVAAVAVGAWKTFGEDQEPDSLGESTRPQHSGTTR